MSFERIIQLIDQALLCDQRQPCELQPDQVISEIQELGPQLLHRVYYDGGLFNQPVVVEALKLSGVMHQIVTDLIVARKGEYSEHTLRKMYGLPD